MDFKTTALFKLPCDTPEGGPVNTVKGVGSKAATGLSFIP